ncbi:MAG: haloacid dehalogenase type II [Rhodospirillales bacterium]
MAEGNGTLTVAFDVYGTLVDPAGMTEQLRVDVGDDAAAFAALWREKQVEYAFRRGLMQHYATFFVCIAEALEYCTRRFNADISVQRRAELMEAYEWLPAFADAEPGLTRMREAGHRLFAFSNGTAAHVDTLLTYSGLRQLLDGIISVDDVKTFKPAPAVYAHVRRASGAWSEPCWLISSNAWDVIGARAAGLHAAWVQRSPAQIFDPWGIEPTLTIGSLAELADRLVEPGLTGS